MTHGPVTGQTKSNMSLLWHSCYNVPDGLRGLAEELEIRELTDQVIGLNLEYTGLDDEYPYQVSALIEDTR